MDLTSPKATVIQLLALMLITTVVFVPGLGGAFIYDDVSQIVRNEKVLNPQSLTDPLFSEKRRRRVVLNYSLGLNGWLGGMNPVGYKVFNLLLHLLTVGFVFLWLRRAFNGPFLAFLSALVFAVHPLQVQSVSYIMGRVSLLVGLFTFAALYLMERRRDYPLGGILALIIAALLSKEGAIVLVALLPLYQALVIERKPQFLLSAKALFTYATSLLLIPLWLFLTENQDAISGTVGFDIYPYGEYLVNQFYYYTWYLIHFLLPVEQSLYHPLMDPGPRLYAWAAVGIGGIGASIFAGFRYWKSHPLAVFLGALFFLHLLPTNSFIQMINPFAEYRVYVSNLSFSVALAGLGAIAFQKWNLSAFLKTTVSVIVLLFFMAFTWKWTSVYGNGFAACKVPAVIYPNYELTLRYASFCSYQEGDFKAAQMALESSLELPGKEKFYNRDQNLLELAFFRQLNQDFKGALEVLSRLNPDALNTAGLYRYYRMRLNTLQVLGNDREAFDELHKQYKARFPKAEDVDFELQ